MVASRNNHNVGACQRRSRLTQSACRKQVTATERIRRIDQNDIDVARQLQMLKPVVKNERSDASVSEFAAACEAICADSECDTVAQARLQQPHFVAGRI